ncbi:hypothetical protein ACHHYP_16098 [Achlya hypogyna]|uniref:PX domain-containing protein n=1 Tax=Achlya hypogyna TaxID=1202772 RepID=A0A1V9ZEB8_ACHHY|nr:hypothetical protein ACHHYP_16098 [Achlya hypogyna]
MKSRGVLGTKIVTLGGVEAAMDPFSLAICRVAVAAADPAEGCTLYAVQAQNAISGRSWVVYRRYSDFVLFREKMLCHLQAFVEVVPKAFNRVMGLPFPKKQAFARKSTLRHRQDAFLAFLRAVHDVLLDPEYFLHHDISYMGFAIFKGFLGSRLHVLHYNLYHCHTAVPQYKLPVQDRACVIQCGGLATVLEEAAPVVVYKQTQENDHEASMTASLVSEEDDPTDPASPATKKQSSWKSKAHRALSIKKLSKSQLLHVVG